MGITGLLPRLKPNMSKISTNQLRGKRIGIDGYVWLHKGIFTCASDLAQGISTDKYVTYFMKLLDSVTQAGLIPYIVFDGTELPSKRGTEVERRRKREEYRKTAMEEQSSGRMSDAYSSFAKSVDVTPLMAYQVIRVLRSRNIDFVVAPYEADAQLAYLCMHGIIDIVLTEDSDLIPHGCLMALFKYDQNGTGDLYIKENVFVEKNGEFFGWDDDKFLDLCILAGCDYVSSLPGIGFGKAEKLMRSFNNIDLAINNLKSRRGHPYPEDYEQNVRNARITFRHQIVYDPRERRLVHKHPLPEGYALEDFPFLGEMWTTTLARLVCEGHCDPTDHTAFETGTPRSMISDSLATPPKSDTPRVSPYMQTTIRNERTKRQSPPETQNKIRDKETSTEMQDDSLSPSKRTKSLESDRHSPSPSPMAMALSPPPSSSKYFIPQTSLTPSPTTPFVSPTSQDTRQRLDTSDDSQDKTRTPLPAFRTSPASRPASVALPFVNPTLTPRSLPFVSQRTFTYEQSVQHSRGRCSQPLDNWDDSKVASPAASTRILPSPQVSQSPSAVTVAVEGKKKTAVIVEEIEDSDSDFDFDSKPEHTLATPQSNPTGGRAHSWRMAAQRPRSGYSSADAIEIIDDDT